MSRDININEQQNNQVVITSPGIAAKRWCCGDRDGKRDVSVVPQGLSYLRADPTLYRERTLCIATTAEPSTNK
ncbi:hypothetical protein EYF80_026451 [Liparis tanakae]|uniref:Uncharacterized protein n=1 Tax=Liparis tanakae TaxID=230148 RepID=A0A4Z2HBZ9_9TELE|nr:hypothetical protein EYF80_026451 [Liparis tanakae]